MHLTPFRNKSIHVNSLTWLGLLGSFVHVGALLYVLTWCILVSAVPLPLLVGTRSVCSWSRLRLFGGALR